jgi:hypothetical protein
MINTRIDKRPKKKDYGKKSRVVTNTRRNSQSQTDKEFSTKTERNYETKTIDL